MGCNLHITFFCLALLDKNPKCFCKEGKTRSCVDRCDRSGRKWQQCTSFVFKNTNSSALNSVNHRVEETILNCDLDLSLEEDKKSIISTVEVVEMKENDIELRIWAQFVRSYSEYKQGSQIKNRHENLDVSTKVGLSHSTIHDKTKTMLSDFE